MSKSTTVDFEEGELDDYIYRMDNLNIKQEKKSLDDYIFDLDEEHQKEKEAEESLNDYIFDLKEEYRRSQLKITLTRKQMITALIDKCQFTIEKAEWITTTLQDLITEEC